MYILFYLYIYIFYQIYYVLHIRFTLLVRRCVCIQKGTSWEWVVLGALYTCNGLVCSLQSHLCSYFPCFRIELSHEKTQQKNTKHIARSIELCHLHLFFFVFSFFWGGFFLVCLFLLFSGSLFDVDCFFWAGKTTQRWHDLTLCDFSPLRGCKLVFGCFIVGFLSVVPLENHVKTVETCMYQWGKLKGCGHGLGMFENLGVVDMD